MSKRLGGIIGCKDKTYSVVLLLSSSMNCTFEKEHTKLSVLCIDRQQYNRSYDFTLHLNLFCVFSISWSFHIDRSGLDKINLNASKPSEHPPIRGQKV